MAHEELGTPYKQPFYRVTSYQKPAGRGEDPDSYRFRLARFRNKKDGWEWIRKTLEAWRNNTIEPFETGGPRSELLQFFTKLICIWADMELHIDPTPLRLIDAFLECEYLRLTGRNLAADPTAIERRSDKAAVLLRDAIVVWERIYDVSEIRYSPVKKVDGKPRRPAFDRDHLWLKWQEEDGLTPAAIRARWNEMDRIARDAACPMQSEAIKEGQKGRNVVIRVGASRPPRRRGRQWHLSFSDN